MRFVKDRMGLVSGSRPDGTKVKLWPIEARTQYGTQFLPDIVPEGSPAPKFIVNSDGMQQEAVSKLSEESLKVITPEEFAESNNNESEKGQSEMEDNGLFTITDFNEKDSEHEGTQEVPKNVEATQAKTVTKTVTKPVAKPVNKPKV